MDFPFGKIHYQTSCSGKKTILLFLHATCSSAASFLPMVELLKDEYDLVILDFPGHGLSDPIKEEKNLNYYGLVGLVNLLVEFINKLKLKNVICFGNSLGANVSIRSIPFLKTVIKALILESSLHGETIEDFASVSTQVINKELMTRRDLNQNELKILTAAYLGKNPSKKIYEKMSYDIAHTDKQFREQLMFHIDNEKWPDELKLIKDSHLPVLYIGGVEDAFIQPTYYKKLIDKKVIKDSCLRLIEGVGHVPHLENPQICSQIILEFTHQLARPF
jgi:pimeloyl-ACP methyl ester carboxylesterase